MLGLLVRRSRIGFGLVDTLGNVWEWTQDRRRFYPVGKEGNPSNDSEDAMPILEKDLRVSRGSSFGNPAPFVRSAQRYFDRPTNHMNGAGFRIAKTIK